MLLPDLPGRNQDRFFYRQVREGCGIVTEKASFLLGGLVEVRFLGREKWAMYTEDSERIGEALTDAHVQGLDAYINIIRADTGHSRTTRSRTPLISMNHVAGSKQIPRAQVVV